MFQGHFTFSRSTFLGHFHAIFFSRLLFFISRLRIINKSQTFKFLETFVKISDARETSLFESIKKPAVLFVIQQPINHDAFFFTPTKIYIKTLKEWNKKRTKKQLIRLARSLSALPGFETPSRDGKRFRSIMIMHLHSYALGCFVFFHMTNGPIRSHRRIVISEFMGARLQKRQRRSYKIYCE